MVLDNGDVLCLSQDSLFKISPDGIILWRQDAESDKSKTHFLE